MRRQTGSMVIVSGKIGAGKSTLCKKIAETGEMQVFFEPADGNVYLNLFYAEPEKYAFIMQMYLLVNRICRFIEALSGKKVVMDRSYLDDRLFMNINFKSGAITEEERDIYMRYFEQLDRELFNSEENPLLTKITFVYLDAPTDVVQRRIMVRSRNCESSIPDDYHEKLSDEYAEFFKDIEARGGNVIFLPFDRDNDKMQIEHAMNTILSHAIPLAPLENRATINHILNQMCDELKSICESRGIMYSDPRGNMINKCE